MTDFHSTLWSVVLRAKDENHPNQKTALNQLCLTYWPAVYAYLRRKGHSAETAKDTTQGFFVHFLERELLDRTDPAQGRFKNYLLAILENYLANEYRRAHAAKRGGGLSPLSLDFDRAETRMGFEPADPETPEAAFRRSWALTVLSLAFDALREEFEKQGRGDHFETIRSHLSAVGDRTSYEDLASRMGTTVPDVTNLLHRSRKRLGTLIRDRLRETVENEADLEEEVRGLFEAL